MNIVARNDAEAAILIDSNIDVRDHPFIMEAKVPGLSKECKARACLMTFGDAVLSQIISLNVNQRQNC